MPRLSRAPRTVMFVLPHLRAGGIESVVRTLANRLNRSDWRPVLFLRRAEGALLDTLAPDVRVIDGGGRRAAFLAPRLARAIRHEQASVVYAGTNAANVAALLARFWLRPSRRPKLVISEHTSATAYLETAKQPALRRALIRALYPRADRLIAPLDDVARDWIDTLHLPGPRVQGLPNPVFDPDHIAALQKRKVPRDPGLIVAAGRLEPVKGHDILLRAFAQIAPDHPTARLHIYGEGSQEQALDTLIGALGLTGRAELRGYCADLPGVFARAQLVALASWREGFGNVLVEALAAGADVLATDCAGPRAILGPDRPLPPPGDITAMAHALQARLRQPPDPAQIARNTRRAAPYGFPAAVSAFEDLLFDLLCG